MKKINYCLQSFLNALGVFVYVLALAGLFSISGKMNIPEPNFLIPVFMLLLFIISASITGFLVLGKPILLYLDNLKKEAFALLFSTIGWLIAFLILTVIILILS